MTAQDQLSDPPAGITGVILAGGLARRMGGADKGLQTFRGRPLVAHVIERLQPQVDRLIINANRNLDAYAAFGLPLLPDALGDFPGPLAGLHAALSQAQTPWVATAPCDSPLLARDLVSRLLAAAETHQKLLAIAKVGERSHPVFCVCHTRLLEALAAYLAQGERRVMAWCSAMGAIEVDFSDQPEAFGNFNTLADLAAEKGSSSDQKH